MAKKGAPVGNRNAAGKRSVGILDSLRKQAKEVDAAYLTQGKLHPDFKHHDFNSKAPGARKYFAATNRLDKHTFETNPIKRTAINVFRKT